MVYLHGPLYVCVWRHFQHIVGQLTLTNSLNDSREVTGERRIFMSTCLERANMIVRGVAAAVCLLQVVFPKFGTRTDETY